MDARRRHVSSETQLLVSSLCAVHDNSTIGLLDKDTFKPGKVRIVGLSRDTVEKQKLFVEKEKLTVSRLGFILILMLQVTYSSVSSIK